MQKNFTLVALFWAFITMSASAQTYENFNSRTDVTLEQVKPHLTGQCWIFKNVQINSGTIPTIEGDGVTVFGPATSPTQETGFYTPVLEMWGYLKVTFTYKLTGPSTDGARKWMKIFVTDGENNIVGTYLDSVELTGKPHNADQEYSGIFEFPKIGSGSYKVYVNFQGINSTSTLEVDKFWASQNKRYSIGCNQPPVGEEDEVQGNSKYEAKGKVLLNDSDPDNDFIYAKLEQDSKDGTVELFGNGDFTFKPKPGFRGEYTTFTYRVCDQGVAPLCSDPITVTINFPAGGPLPVTLIDFKGIAKPNGDVEISWITTFEVNSDRFEVERSSNGTDWEKVGTVAAQGNSNTKVNYSFTDKPKKAAKKDLYYRLRQLDKDGTPHVTKILVVRVYNNTTLKMVSVTPNPVKNDIVVYVQVSESSLVVMKVINSFGAEVMRKTAKFEAGTRSVTLDGTSMLKPGMYVLDMIINGNERMVVKLVKE